MIPRHLLPVHFPAVFCLCGGRRFHRVDFATSWIGRTIWAGAGRDGMGLTAFRRLGIWRRMERLRFRQRWFGGGFGGGSFAAADGGFSSSSSGAAASAVAVVAPAAAVLGVAASAAVARAAVAPAVVGK